MKKCLLVLILLLSIFHTSASDDVLYSGEINQSDDYIEVEVEDSLIRSFNFKGSTSHLEIVKNDYTGDEFDVLESYKVSVSGNKTVNINLVLDKERFEDWSNESDYEFYNYGIVNSKSMFYRILNDKNTDPSAYRGSYFSNIAVPHNKTTIHVFGVDYLYENLTTAINPQESFCGKYWKPPENYTKVNSCSGNYHHASIKIRIESFRISLRDTYKDYNLQDDFSFETFLIILSALGLLGISFVVLIMKKTIFSNNSKEDIDHEFMAKSGKTLDLFN